jgi:segregation and condensation protein B
MAESTDETMNEPTLNPDAQAEAALDAADDEAVLRDGEVLPPDAGDADRPSPLVGNDPAQQLRLIEALIFASATTLDEAALAERLPEGADLDGLLSHLAELYAGRGVNLVKVAGGYAFRTAPDLAAKLQIEKVVQRKLSRASVETLAIIAYHQPVTRAEIEQIRGVGLSKGTLDLLFEQNWIVPLGRRRAPGKPVTWGTTEFFLEHFGLGNLEDLPGFDDLKAAGLLDARADVQIYRPDEPDLPLEGDDEEDAEPLTGEEAPADGNDEPKAA